MLLQSFYILLSFMTCFKAKIIMQTSEFSKDTVSNFQNKLDNGCITLHDRHVTELDCSRECSKTDSCEGFSQDEKQNCYIHSRCFKPVTSASVHRSNDSVNLGLTFYARRVRENCCLNGGVFNPQTESCQCSEGMIGPCCERYPESCKELREYSHNVLKKTDFLLQPPGYSSPFFTQCIFLDDETRTVIALLRNKNNLNFNRTWDEYVNGFRDTEEGNYYDFWIGLKHLAYLTQVLNLRRMSLKIILTGTKSFYGYLYDGVLVGNKTEQFDFYYESVSAIAGKNRPHNFNPLNCFESKSGLKFSTPDVDNDNEDNVHCAKLAGSGWWFGSCSPNPRCNPFGVPYIIGDEEVTPEKMFFEGADMSDNATEFATLRLHLTDSV